MPTKAEIRAAVEKVLKAIQQMSGRQCPPITDATKAIGDLDGFDSLSGVEATSLLEKELNCKLADGSAFIHESPSGKRRALTVAEAVERVAQMLAPTRAA
jgi:acyl carrier protein